MSKQERKEVDLTEEELEENKKKNDELPEEERKKEEDLPKTKSVFETVKNWDQINLTKAIWLRDRTEIT